MLSMCRSIAVLEDEQLMLFAQMQYTVPICPRECACTAISNTCVDGNLPTRWYKALPIQVVELITRSSVFYFQNLRSPHAHSTSFSNLCSYQCLSLRKSRNSSSSTYLYDA